MRTDASIVCLLPVRNGAEDLPEYLDSVAQFADAVVALDDGSTDETRDLLAASPLVKIILTNPPRESYRGWDDGANRNRLLEAAAELDPSWILSLDADERFTPDDAETLRRFVATEALPGFAFGFTVFRVWGDSAHYEPVGYWVYRLFAFEPGQRFPNQRLHFDPVPTSIPRSRWLRTTLRIQHLAGLTAARRAARIEKYREADPGRVSHYRYPDLAETAREIRGWERRPADLPVLVAAGPAVHQDDAPALSAVVISRNDEDRIARTVSSVLNQECQWPLEVIVVTSGMDRTAEVVRRQFPQVTLVELPHPALPGEARNAGLRVARGDYVSFPGSHVELPQGSLAARIRAHDLGYAMVTGTTFNGTATRAGWASYFLDHSTVLPGRPSMKLGGPPAHCSYLREALLAVGGFPEDMRSGEDTVVNNRLASRGYEAYRAQEVALIHHTPCHTIRRLLQHHFVRGRGYGRILLDQRRHDGGLLRRHRLRSLFRLQVLQRVDRTARRVEAWGGDELRGEYRRVRSLIVAGTVVYWLGTCYELLRPGRAKAFLLWGSPVVTLLLTRLNGQTDAVTLARVDVIAQRVKVLGIPAKFVIELPGIGRRQVGEALRSDPELLVETLNQTLGVAVDGYVLTGPHRAPWALEVIRAARRSPQAKLSWNCRLTLLWARLKVRPEDVHNLTLDDRLIAVKKTESGFVAASDPDEVVRVIRRCLDTRSRRERVATVQPAPEPGRPRWRSREPSAALPEGHRA